METKGSQKLFVSFHFTSNFTFFAFIFLNVNRQVKSDSKPQKIVNFTYISLTKNRWKK